MKRMQSCYIVFLIVIIVQIVTSATASAQNFPKISIPYSCGFEDSEAAENALWVLNGKTSVIPVERDQWYRGASVFSEGRKSLYVSCDGGISPHFCYKKNITVVYRPITFPQGSYVLTFDWQNNAVVGGVEKGMYVCFIQSGAAGLPSTGPESLLDLDRLPIWASSYIMPITKTDGSSTSFVAGTQEWENASVGLRFSSEKSGYLAFVWRNAITDSIHNPLAACLDNIQITSADCTPPSNLTLEAKCDTVVARWRGTSEKYVLEYKQNGTDRWVLVGNVYNKTEYVVAGIDEGIYDFRVRGICNDTILSAWNTRNGVVVFCPENHCLNYTVLSHKENKAVQCYVGDAGKNNWTQCEPMDFGPTTNQSRHAVCWLRNATDPMTNNGLVTIPPGEFVSIRLGNPLFGGEAERIDFDFHVDDPNMILLLKYAIVFEDPVSHDEEQKPFFSLSILDKNGLPFPGSDFDCGKAQFYANSNRHENGWHTAKVTGKSEPISWKEWTTVGINMSKYVGRDIKISLETHDCTLGGHFGYAYFTLGCADGTIESVSCGADEFMDIKAPEGFDYRWFTQYDAQHNPLDNKGQNQTITVPSSDKTVYRCRCMFKEDHGCYFDLYTVVSPREAFADFEWEHIPSNCENKVRLKNKSHVTTIDDATGELIHTDEPAQTAYWYVNGSKEPVTRREFDLILDNEGETVNVELVAGISADRCQDDTTITITVPSIVTPAVTLDTLICYGRPVQWGNKYIMESGVYPDSLVNIAGCDSIVWLRVNVMPEIEDTYDTAWICFGDTLFYTNGEAYAEEAESKIIYFESASGCDSIVYLTINVGEEIKCDVTAKDIGDEPNSGEILITDAPEGYYWTVNDVKNGPLTGLSGGQYDVVVYDSIGCASDVFSLFLDQTCLLIDADFENLQACADDSVIEVQYEIVEGYMSQYKIEYGEEAAHAGFVDYDGTADKITIKLPDGVRPGRYSAKVIFGDRLCNDTVIDVVFDVLYDAGIVVQKWNDVLAVQNDRYNGGYVFSAYQWYKDNVVLPGERNPFLYTGEYGTLEFGGEYSVALTRADDGVTAMTCPIVPEEKSDVREYPVATTAAVGAMVKIMNVSAPTLVKIYTVSGILYSVVELNECKDSVLMPYEPGVYVMVFESGDTTTHAKVVVEGRR